MENLTNMTRTQLTDFVATFERNAFNWTDGAEDMAHSIERALAEDTDNAVPADTPASLTASALSEPGIKTVLYSAIHELNADIEARDTIDEGGDADITPITPEPYEWEDMADMWLDGYRQSANYAEMSAEEQADFDDKAIEFSSNRALLIVDLNSQLGNLLRAFGWNAQHTAFYSYEYQQPFEHFLIVPDYGVTTESPLFSDDVEAARFFRFALKQGISVNIDSRVNRDDVDVDVVRGFAEAYANLHGIALSDSVLDLLSCEAADRAELYALPLDSVEGQALASLWGVPAAPTFADNLALYKAHKVIAMDGNLYSMKPLSVKVA